jgi:uncharacterized protein YjbI with pentapeptide repeats
LTVASNGNGETTTGAGIAVAQHTTKQKIDVQINGGTISGVAAINESNPQNNSAEDIAKVSVVINGGKLTGKLYSEDNNITYNVADATALTQAFVSGNTGVKVVLTDSLTIADELYEINGNVTLDLNGKNITVDSTKAQTTFVGTDITGKLFRVVKGTFTITGEGEIKNELDTGRTLIQVWNADTKYEAINVVIGEKVTLTAKTPIGVWGTNGGVTNNYGNNIVIDIYGTLNSANCGLTINGNVEYENAEATGIKVNVYGTAVLTDTKGEGLYLAGYATTTVYDGAKITGATDGIEIRAGKLVVNGGTIISTATTTSVTANGSGSTTVGAAIAVAQHTTKQATEVEINGGTLKGKYSVYESNPQKNGAEDIAKVAVVVNGYKSLTGYIYSQDNVITCNASTANGLYGYTLLSISGVTVKLVNDLSVTKKSNAYITDGEYYYMTNTIRSGVVVDGQGYTINFNNEALRLAFNTYGTIKNLNVTKLAEPLVSWASNGATFKNVDVDNSTMQLTNNQAVYVQWTNPDTIDGVDYCEVTFEGCDVGENVKLIGEGDSTGYNAVFVGYNINGVHLTLNFTNCSFSGTYVSGEASMFLGNVNSGYITLNITNTYNYGSIRSTYIDPTTQQTWQDNQFVSINTSSCASLTINMNGQSYTSTDAEELSIIKKALSVIGTKTVDGKEVKGSVQYGPIDATLKLTEGDENVLTFTKSESTEVAYYVVSLTVYTTLKDDAGTRIQTVSETIQATDAETYTATIKHLSFIDSAYLEGKKYYNLGTQFNGFDLVFVGVDGEFYYLINETGDDADCTIGETPKAASYVTVTAYDKDGNVIASVGLSK